MVFTFNSSTSAPSLCSALAIADSSTFLMMCARFFGLKAGRLSAFSTGSPRIWSATSRPFWADSRTPWSVARVSMGLLLLLAARSRGGSRRGGRRRGSRRSRSSGGCVRSAGPRSRRGFQKLLVGHSVALEDARQRELPELVSHHVFRDVHRDVLLAVVDRDGEPDEIRQNRGAPRPGLDRALVACRARRADGRARPARSIRGCAPRCRPRRSSRGNRRALCEPPRNAGAPGRSCPRVLAAAPRSLLRAQAARPCRAASPRSARWFRPGCSAAARYCPT